MRTPLVAAAGVCGYCSVEHHFYRLPCFAVQRGTLPLAVPQVWKEYVFDAEARVVLLGRHGTRPPPFEKG